MLQNCTADKPFEDMYRLQNIQDIVSPEYVTQFCARTDSVLSTVNGNLQLDRRFYIDDVIIDLRILQTLNSSASIEYYNKHNRQPTGPQSDYYDEGFSLEDSNVDESYFLETYQIEMAYTGIVRMKNIIVQFSTRSEIGESFDCISSPENIKDFIQPIVDEIAIQ